MMLIFQRERKMLKLSYIKPPIRISVYELKGGDLKRKYWNIFKRHHYLNQKFNIASRCFIGVWDDVVVVFNASLPLPGKIPPLHVGEKKVAWRESRTVVLPDFQGLGIGTRFSNAIGEIFLKRNCRFFSKTAHIKMGEYRQKSPLWRKTSTNLVSREKSRERSPTKQWNHYALDTKRICYSHEYIGKSGGENGNSIRQGSGIEEVKD